MNRDGKVFLVQTLACVYLHFTYRYHSSPSSFSSPQIEGRQRVSSFFFFLFFFSVPEKGNTCAFIWVEWSKAPTVFQLFLPASQQ